MPGSKDTPPTLPVNTVTPEGLHDEVVVVTVDRVAVEVVEGAWTPWQARRFLVNSSSCETCLEFSSRASWNFRFISLRKEVNGVSGTGMPGGTGRPVTAAAWLD